MQEFMSKNQYASAAWDIMGCVRGPDSPSERPDMKASEASAAYGGRRKRKYETVEVLREEMFFGACGGSARHHKDDHVKLPSPSSYDHFDKHIERGARAIGIKVQRKKSHED